MQDFKNMGYICANGAPLVMLLKRNAPEQK